MGTILKISSRAGLWIKKLKAPRLWRGAGLPSSTTSMSQAVNHKVNYAPVKKEERWKPEGIRKKRRSTANICRWPHVEVVLLGVEVSRGWRRGIHVPRFVADVAVSEYRFDNMCIRVYNLGSVGVFVSRLQNRKGDGDEEKSSWVRI